MRFLINIVIGFFRLRPFALFILAAMFAMIAGYVGQLERAAAAAQGLTRDDNHSLGQAIMWVAIGTAVFCGLKLFLGLFRLPPEPDDSHNPDL